MSGRPGTARSTLRNVEASDYVGSQVCARCHSDVAARFAASPMHRMTRNVSDARIVAPFQGESLRLGDDRATLETHGGTRFVRLESGGRLAALYRVTRVIGGRHREDYAGVSVESVDTRPKGELGSDDEVILPVSTVLATKRLRYKGYSVMLRERPRMLAGPVWNRTCIFCHNTVPLLATLYGTLGPSKVPGYQGEVVDRLLPDDRAFHYRVTDESAFNDALTREMHRLGGDSPSGPLAMRLRDAASTTRNRFTGDKLLEVGIGCESCHGGSREHAEDPNVHTSLLPRAPYLSIKEVAPSATHEPSPASVEDHACARCHQVLFTRYPWTWEGGRRNAQAGGSHISSGEARDLMIGGCKGALACTACHDPHASDESAHLAELATPKGNDVCLGCHAALKAPGALKAHAHHDPQGAGGSCVACHMAKKNLSLDGRLSRYHRIGSPTDPERVLGDRPLECALCHADKAVESLVGAMETWWNKHYDRSILEQQYGDARANAMRATLDKGKPHEKAVAMFALGEAKDRESGQRFANELEDDIPLVRGYAVSALRATYGDACDLDLGVDRPSLAKATARCAEASGLSLPALGRGRSVGADEMPADD